MAVDRITLPKDPEVLADVIVRHAQREDTVILFRRTIWLLAHYYLNGARSFTEFDPQSKIIRPLWVDADGNAEFQSNWLLNAINQVVGRFLSYDLRPKVLAQGENLEAYRSRSIAQIIMSSAVSDDQAERVKSEFAFTFACLGCCGLIGHLVDHPTVGLVSDLEVVHPREIIPFPGTGYNIHKQRGIMRQRFVDMNHLIELYGKKYVKSKLKDLDWFQKPIGEDTEIENTGPGSAMLINQGQGIDAYDSKMDVDRDDMTSLVRLRELWTWGPRNMVDRYVISSGRAIIDDIDFGNEEVYCPLGFARFLDTGSFHGAGMFDLLFSMSRQNELLLKSLFNNVRDSDRYGVLVIPQGDMNEKPMLRDVGRGLKMLPWAPDPMTEGFRPFAVQPANTGDFPGKVANMTMNFLRELSPIGDLAAEKGRVDSAQGLSFLDERLNQAMTRPSFGIRACFSEAYRGVGTAMAQGLARSPRALPVGRLSLDLAGAVIDPVHSTVSFSQNPIPDLSRLSFSVQEINPRSSAARKGEALDLLEKGVTDPQGFLIHSVLEGIEWAMWMEEDKAAVESIVRDCLILFGDGQAPGEVTVSPYCVKPDVQLRILSGFMARPLFRLASVDVQDAFALYRDTLLQFSGRVLPEAVPNPDDAAMLMGAGATPGGPPSSPPSNGPPR